MRPILFNKSETSFDTYGLGELNVTKGTVTRERNGNYTLYAEIPVNDPAVASLGKEMKLKADAGLRTKNQTFEISRIVKDSSNIVKIYGQHISHKLEYIVLRNATAFSGTAYNALAIWKNALIGDLTFEVWSDIQTSNKGVFDISKMENARLALGGVEGSILDLYGGEYEFDNMTIRLHKQLGRTAPTVLEYGRNILSAELDETIESSYTSVLPFATYTPDRPEGSSDDSQPDPITVTIPENYVDSKYKALYAHRRIKVVDFSSEFSTDSKKKNIPNADKLRKLATDFMEKNAIGKPKINIKIEYADLAKTLDYADNGWIEELELCDIVPVYYPQIGLTDETAKVTTITYDFVNERNESVEFGDIGTNVRATMQSGLAGKIDDIAKSQEKFENSLPDYLLNAQGNKVWYNRPDNTEHKIGDIWFEKNGLYDRMYVWNGSQWEKRIDTEDVDKVKKEVNRQLEEAKTTNDRAIAEATAKAQEALTKAGTIPDTSKLSDQIKQQILSSQDFQNKVTEGINRVDGDTIYNKIYSNIEQSFAPQSYADYLNNKLSDTKGQVSDLDRRIASQTVEFNKLTESNKLYERIIGTSETDAPDKLSRLVMSSQIFQTEVGKYSTSGGPNMLKNSRADDGLKYWNGDPSKFRFLAHQFYLNGQKRMFQLSNGAVVNSPRFIFKKNTDYMLNMLAFDANTARFTVELRKRKKNSANQDYDEIQTIFDKTGTPAFDSSKAVKKSFKFNTGDFDNGYLLFIYEGVPNVWSGLFMTELDFYEGSSPRLWQPCPDDSNEPLEAVRTQVTQLAGTYSIKNINSAGDILGQLNLNKDGSIKLNEALIAIGEKTYVKDGVIKKAMIGDGQIGTAHIGEIDANIARLINVSAKNIVSDGLTANIIKGGILSSSNGSTFFNLNDGYFESNGTNSRIMINDGAFDFTTKSGKGIAGYSTMYSQNRITGGAIGSHNGFDFSITTKTGARSMLAFTDNNKMVVSNSMTIVSDQASYNEYIGIKLKRYNKGGGWCTAIISSQGSSGIEFYDDGKVRLLTRGSYWEPK
ncbi:phage tail spike protein [uncultured Streptococcus sp.]|uniref:phage tail spike protein n=1 Tax=uncultured Streptococcus sp. TaxID=83427 RepID=UPI002674D11B|nr:phage tail spike protein [uncultured Streptococcus sp.]